MLRFFVFIALAAGSVAAQPALGDSLHWERVGADTHTSVSEVAFTADGNLYAMAGRIGFPGDQWGESEIARLAPPFGPDTPWETVRQDTAHARLGGKHVYRVGPDTLIIRVRNEWLRTSDYGNTVEAMEGIPGGGSHSSFAEITAGPYAGTLVTSGSGPSDRMLARSRDRGASWQFTPNPLADASFPVAFCQLVALPRDPHAGRVVATCGLWGAATSDDGGASYQPTAFWEPFGLELNAAVLLSGAAPGGKDRIVSIGATAQTGNLSVWVSDNGGDSWRYTQFLPDIDRQDSRPVKLMDLGGGRAVAISNWGHVFETTDGAETWVRRASVLPNSVRDGSLNNPHVYSAKLGPDRRIYVSGLRNGPVIPGTTNRLTWAWRTTEPYAVLVASDDAAPSALPLDLSVHPNPARQATQIRIDRAAPGPARVVVVDALGRRVAVLHDGPGAASLDLSVDTSGWPSGIYAAVVTAGSARVATRFTVIR